MPWTVTDYAQSIADCERSLTTLRRNRDHLQRMSIGERRDQLLETAISAVKMAESRLDRLGQLRVAALNRQRK